MTKLTRGCASPEQDDLDVLQYDLDHRADVRVAIISIGLIGTIFVGGLVAFLAYAL